MVSWVQVLAFTATDIVEQQLQLTSRLGINRSTNVIDVRRIFKLSRTEFEHDEQILSRETIFNCHLASRQSSDDCDALLFAFRETLVNFFQFSRLC